MHPLAQPSSSILEAFLKCETKAYLLFKGAVGILSDTERVRRALTNRFTKSASEHLKLRVPNHEQYIQTPSFSEIKQGLYRLISNPEIAFPLGCAQLHALERVQAASGRAPAIYWPIRFSQNEKLTAADKLLLAFDALATTHLTGNPVTNGKIIHGARQNTTTIHLTTQITSLRKLLKSVKEHQASATPPALVLNRHCSVCEFQTRCRKIAIEKDDLSLLSSVTAKTRSKLNDRGIFTVMQLSYTFRPRRYSARTPQRVPKHDPALQALAIRNDRVHVIGTPTLTVAGNLVYLDVEGIPDRDFYYLVGLRFVSNGVHLQQSFWTDNSSDERDIWASCFHSLRHIENPTLVHYGSYEIQFLRRMKARYIDGLDDRIFLDHLISSAINIVSSIYAKIYFPTYSNLDFAPFRQRSRRASSSG
jgi:predicted RecB family nuclease